MDLRFLGKRPGVLCEDWSECQRAESHKLPALLVGFRAIYSMCQLHPHTGEWKSLVGSLEESRISCIGEPQEATNVNWLAGHKFILFNCWIMHPLLCTWEQFSSPFLCLCQSFPHMSHLYIHNGYCKSTACLYSHMYKCI